MDEELLLPDGLPEDVLPLLFEEELLLLLPEELLPEELPLSLIHIWRIKS